MTSKQKVLVVAGATVGTVGLGVIAYKLIKIHKLRNVIDEKLDDIYSLTNKTGELFCCLQDTVYDDETTDEMYTLIVEKCSEMLTNVKMFRVINSGIVYEYDSSKNCSNKAKSLVEELIGEYNSLFHDLSNSLSSPKDGHILDKYNEFYTTIYEKLKDLVTELTLNVLERV